MCLIVLSALIGDDIPVVVFFVKLRGKVEQCDTDQDGHPMTFDFFVLTEADTASVKRLTKPSSLGQLDIPYGPRAYLSGGNSFTVQVSSYSN